MKIFLDANILVSVINREYPLYNWSSRILSLQGIRNFQLLTSPLCLAITFYFAVKKSGKRLALEKIKLLARNIGMTALDAMAVQHALNDPRIQDFEDGLEYYSAQIAGCDFIVTEDQQDFWFSTIPVMDCRDFLMFIQKESTKK